MPVFLKDKRGVNDEPEEYHNEGKCELYDA